MIIFSSSAQNICCGYSFEAPRPGASNEYPQYMFYGEIRKTTPALSPNRTSSLMNHISCQKEKISREMTLIYEQFHGVYYYNTESALKFCHRTLSRVH